MNLYIGIWFALCTVVYLIVAVRIIKDERISKDDGLFLVTAAFTVYFLLWALGLSIIIQIWG